jgi:hypothetical protein
MAAAIPPDRASSADRAPRRRDPVVPGADRATRLAIQGEIRDRQQLELRFNYALGGGAGAQAYVVDTYLFVPRNIGLNRTNYTRDEFYADVTALLRLDAVPLPIADLASPSRATSPMHALHRSLEAFRSSPRPPDSRSVIVQVKLYAYLFTAAARERLAALADRLESVDGEDVDAARALEADMAAATKDIRAALAAYRSLRGALWPFEKVADESMPEAMRSADEYMSVYLDERLALFAAALDASSLGAFTATRARLRQHAAILAQDEAAYRRRYGYLTFATGAAEGEYYSYRSSLLKKVVQQALYLDPREVKADTFVRNGVGAVGAALAAIWALAAQIPATLARASGMTQTLLLAIPVLAYVLKDRIKALTNEFLTAKFRRFDHTAWLGGSGLRNVGLGMLRARIREVMRFQSSAAVPADVRVMRAAHRTVQGAESTVEEVIHYRKVIEVNALGETAGQYWVRDILRLNVRHFLVRLDDALDKVAFFDAAGARFATAEVPKVYHLNAVVRLSRRSADGTGQERLERMRIVLDKSGIVRTEHVDAKGPSQLPRAKRPLRLPFRLRRP